MADTNQYTFKSSILKGLDLFSQKEQGYDEYVKDIHEIEYTATDKQWIIQISDINNEPGYN